MSADPEEGAPLRKLFALYEGSEGLQKLDDRWAPLSTTPDAKGATFTLLRGLLADHRGKAADALADFQKVTAAQPNDYHGWLALGDFEERQGKLADAVAALQKGLATPVSGNDRLALFRKLGNAQQRNLDTTGSMATWKKMVDEFPKDHYALEEAATALLDADQFDAARATFQKLVDSTDANSMARVQALIRLAEVDDRQGRTEAAVHGYEAILPQTAENSWLNHEIRSDIEQVYRREDDLAGLAAYYKKWIAANPSDVEALLRLSGTLGELGKNDEAVDALRKAAKLDPDRHEVRQTLAQRLVEAKQYDEAISVLTALTADDPTEPRYWETFGEALWLKTQPPTPESKKAVLDAWRKIAPDTSKDVAAILEVGDLEREHTFSDEALADYKRALTISPDSADIRERAVDLLVTLKRQPEAWKLLDGMVDGTQATAPNYLKLANAQAKYERKDDAAASIQKGLALDPKSFDLLETEWSRLAQVQKWPEALALYDRLLAASPNPYFADEVQARQVQALSAGGKLADTTAALRAKLGATPGLTENELQLLARIFIQQSDPDTDKLFTEADTRFSHSVPLARLEIDYQRKVQNYDAAIASLQRLIESDPTEKADWMTRIVQIRRDQGRMDEALKVAGQMIDDSPATAPPYLIYADVAFAANQPDDAITKLQAAIKLSDNPNSVRQRLARYYLESGDTQKARAIYDDAFAAAASPEDKTALIKPMAEAYFQDGQIDDLIGRFKQQQAAEEGGWHYGQYLAQIYSQMDDFGSARRELAKSLAVRPQDTGLLHSLITLAEKENDPGELLHYRQQLAEIDPSTTNEIALANEYATQNKPADSWQVIQRNVSAVSKDPLAWKDVLNNLSDAEYQGKVKALLEDSIRAQGDPFEGSLVLAQFQLQQADLDGAKATLTHIIALPLPPPPPPKPPAPNTSLNGGVQSIYASAYQSSIAMRIQMTYYFQQEAQQYMATGPQRAQSRMIIRQNLAASGMTMQSTPQSIKDRALVYLAVIAAQQQKAQEFLDALKARLDDTHASLGERLAEFSLVQAQASIMDTMEAMAKSGVPDVDLDPYCATVCLNYSNPNYGNDPETAKRATAIADVFDERVAKSNPKFKSQMAMLQLGQAVRSTAPDAAAKRVALLADYLKGVDETKPEDLVGAIQISSMSGQWPQTIAYANKLLASDRKKWPLTMQATLSYLPLMVVQQQALPGAPPALPKEVGPLFAQLLQASYPDQKPPLSMGQQQNQFGYQQNAFPPANRYITAMQVNMIQQGFSRLKGSNLMPDLYKALDAQIAGYSDWHKVYPILWKIYLQWWDGQHDAAADSVRQMVTQDPSDEFRALLASMLMQQQKYADAIPVIDSITARYGPVHVQAQKDLLHAARMANDTATAQKAAQRLLALRLPQDEKMQLLDDLRAVGLGDKADELAKQQSSPGNSQRATMMASQSAMQEFQGSTGDKDPVRLNSLARSVLAGDPLALTPNSYENYVRREALRVMNDIGQLDDYTAGLEKQLDAAPSSVRLNWLVAEAYGAAPDTFHDDCALRPAPHWVKLQRTGSSFEAFRSMDGTTWDSLGKQTVAMQGKVLAGLWVSDASTGAAPKVAFDKVALTGNLSAADEPPPLPAALHQTGPSTVTSVTTISTGGVSTSTTTTISSPPVSANSTPSPATAASVPLPWRESLERMERKAGTSEKKADDAFVLIGGSLRGRMNADNEPVHMIYQALDGDGTIIARVADLSAEPANTRAGIVMCQGPFPEPSRPAFRIALQRESGWLLQGHEQGSNNRQEIRVQEDYKMPTWLKLARAGDDYTGSFSDDGKTWTKIFSRHQRLNEKLYVGLNVMSGNSSAGSDDSIAAKYFLGVPQITGSTGPADATPVPPMPTGVTGVPTGWRYVDVGDVAQPGKVAWSDAGLEMDAPWSTKGSPNFSAIGLLLRPLAGDGEITVELKDMKDSKQARPALVLMEAPDLNASIVEMNYNIEHRFSFYVHAPAQNRSVELYKKVAQLDPKNQQALVMVASSLMQQKRESEACDLYLVMLKGDASAVMQDSGNVAQAFMRAKRVPELVKFMEDWNPPAFNPMTGGQDSFWAYVNIAQQLSNDDTADAEAIYRKALKMDTYQDKMQAYSGLIGLLKKENKNDEASAELQNAFLQLSEPPQQPRQPILGANRYFYRGSWMQSIGFGQNGQIYSNGVDLLRQASDMGILPTIEKKLKEKAAQPPANSSWPDEAKLAVTLVEVMMREPGYKADLDKLMTSPTVSNDQSALLLICQELARWPQEQPEVLSVLKQLQASLQSQNNYWMGNCVTNMQMTIAEATDDHKLLQEALKAQVANLAQQRMQNPQGSFWQESARLVTPMLKEGMIKDAADLVAQLPSDPMFRNGNSITLLTQLQHVIAFEQGHDDVQVAPVYGFRAAAKGKQEFFWQLSGFDAGSRGPYSSRTQWSGEPAHPTTFTLNIEAGPDEQHLALVQTLPHVASLGAMALKLPASAQFLRATAIPPAPPKPPTPAPGAAAPPVTPAAPAPTMTLRSSPNLNISPNNSTASAPPGPAPGHLIILGAESNVLPNPEFTLAKDTTGNQTVAHWTGLPATSLAKSKGGPLPISGYVTFSSKSDAVSDRIPLPPGSDIVTSGWWRGNGFALTYRFYDATGKKVDEQRANVYQQDDSWTWSTDVCVAAGSMLNGRRIPENAVALELVGHPTQDTSSEAGWSVRLIPHVAAATKPPEGGGGSDKKKHKPAAR